MIDGPWIPQNDSEEYLLMAIFVATRKAHSEGVSKQRIASCLAFQAAATLDPQAEDVEPVDTPEEPEGFHCPECGERPTNARGSMGTSVVTLGCCGHGVDLSELSDENREHVERLLTGGELA